MKHAKSAFLKFLFCTVVIATWILPQPAEAQAVTELEEGHVVILVTGEYEDFDRDALLSEVNRIRKEAKDEGLVDRYVPLVWSNGLEETARTRAAELTVVPGHIRPRGGRNPYMTASNGLRNSAESLAFNERGIFRGVEQFYAEKDAFLATDLHAAHVESSDQMIGHYRVLIDPVYQRVGAASFYSPDSGVYQVAFAFSSAPAERKMTLPAFPHAVPVEIDASRVTALALSAEGIDAQERDVVIRVTGAVTRTDLFADEGRTTMTAPIVNGLSWEVLPTSAGTLAPHGEEMILTFSERGPVTVRAQIGGVEGAVALEATPSEPSTPAEPKPQPEGTGTRIDGPRREHVAAEVARRYFGDADTVLVVNDMAFGDAISASNLSGGASPILYTKKDALPEASREVLRELAPQRVVVLGGPSSVSRPVVDDIARTAPAARVERISGADRYAVNAKTLASTAGYVAVSGTVFSDALVAAPYAASMDAQVALTTPFAVPEVLAARLSTVPASVVIVGGPASVPESVARRLGTLTGVAPSRVTGRDRYALSAAVAARFSEKAPAILVSGETFADALVAAPLAQRLHAPILLTRAHRLSEEVAEALSNRQVIILGGPASVGEDVAAALQ
ncbi:MAG: cell wall-binding repeat-containing protein [Peptoniphilaceae bacterium]|nr:cell wall-binding repeat-containing protein [Peptoniphilaceae bacterium]